MWTGAAKKRPTINNENASAQRPTISCAKAAGSPAAKINGIEFTVISWVDVDNGGAIACFQKLRHQALPLFYRELLSPYIHCCCLKKCSHVT
jgi:hypothetical protein